jgi:glycerol-3-phosphate acyltransferase PlsX
MQKSKSANSGDLHRPRIGIDLLGSDLPARQLLIAILNSSFQEAHAPLLTFFGTAKTFHGLNEAEEVQFCPISQVIEPGDDALAAIRTKKDSSMMAGIHRLKEHALDALITAGNSGALLAAASLYLPLLPSIERPGFIALMPTKEEPIAVIDVGANVDVNPEHFLQFAKMGIAYQKSRGIARPTVGLLNIGEEKKKGTLKHRKAHELLRGLNSKALLGAPVFIGNIEGRDAFCGAINVLVTDGFTGNVFLKTSEGIASFILDQMEHLEALSAIPEVKSRIARLKSRLHFAQYPGALLCGIEGIVIKCHGASTPDAFIHSIHGASHLTKSLLFEKIRAEFDGA